MTIRNATLDDVQEIGELYIDTIRNFPDVLLIQEHEITKEYIENIIYKAEEGGIARVTVIDNKIVGFIKGELADKTRRKHTLCNIPVMIHRDYQKTRVGYNLIKDWCNYIETERQDIRYMIFGAFSNNTQSIKLFKHFGGKILFELKDELRLHENKYIDHICMVWENKNFQPVHLR